jgi:hypothetical protein
MDASRPVHKCRPHFFAKIQTVQSARNLTEQPIVCEQLLRSSTIQTNVVCDYNSICAERLEQFHRPPNPTEPIRSNVKLDFRVRCWFYAT